MVSIEQSVQYILEQRHDYDISAVAKGRTEFLIMEEYRINDRIPDFYCITLAKILEAKEMLNIEKDNSSTNENLLIEACERNLQYRYEKLLIKLISKGHLYRKKTSEKMPSDKELAEMELELKKFMTQSSSRMKDIIKEESMNTASHTSIPNEKIKVFVNKFVQRNIEKAIEGSIIQGKFYVVINGRSPGIYDDWENRAKPQVDGFPCAIYRKFKTFHEAVKFMTKEFGYYKPILEFIEESKSQ